MFFSCYRALPIMYAITLDLRNFANSVSIKKKEKSGCILLDANDLFSTSI